MTLRTSSCGKATTNIAGRIAKYFATSLATENVVSAPRVISSCLPISTMSMSFVGSESRSTMLPASLAAVVPVFIATPTSAWASAGASLVPSPHIATIRPPSCSLRIRASLSSGVASARKSSTPASSAIARAVTALSPVIITVRMPIARISSKRSRMPSLTTSLRWMTPSSRLPRRCSATTSGVPPVALTCSTSWSSSGSEPPTQAVTAEAAPLRISRPGRSIPLIRVVGARTRRASRAPARARRLRPTAHAPGPRSSGPRASRRPARRAAPPRRARRRSTPSSGSSAEACRLP